VVTLIKIYPGAQHAIADSSPSGIASHPSHPIILTRNGNGRTRLDGYLNTIEEGVACRIGIGVCRTMFLGLGVDEMSSPIASLVLGHFGSSGAGDMACLWEQDGFLD
jgi:hypothetical protein